jgi:hypothetical protein
MKRNKARKTSVRNNYKFDERAELKKTRQFINSVKCFNEIH